MGPCGLEELSSSGVHAPVFPCGFSSVGCDARTYAAECNLLKILLTLPKRDCLAKAFAFWSRELDASSWCSQAGEDVERDATACEQHLRVCCIKRD